MSHSNEEMITLTSTEQDDASDSSPSTTTNDTEELVITENSEAGIYEAALGGRTVAGVVYRRTDNHVTLLATSVFPEYRGRRIAARLLSGVLDKLRAQGETVTVTCPFATAFIKSRPEYAEMLRQTRD
ncbi:GNAT family N-acetyltransferase [Streptomyces sp. MAR4 CNX-425]|uniref:GNAT family N-acetyltransferase n=1 Tax=Streptomyces sp. MAR4 CNX-425 TaxID=3406343 RepID=UPI003B500501